MVDKNGRLAVVIVDSGIVTSTFAVGKNGEFVRDRVETGALFDEPGHKNFIDSLVAALEAALGWPKSRPAIAAAPLSPSVAKGKVIDLEGHPIAGAKVSGFSNGKRQHAVTTGPAGDFTYEFEKGEQTGNITVEASGFASRDFRLRVNADEQPGDPVAVFALTELSETVFRGTTLIELSGIIPEPLVLGPGVVVAGRVVRDGMPAAGVPMGLAQIDPNDSPSPSDIVVTETDERGSFRFLHILPETDFWIYAKIGSLKNQGVIIPKRVHTTGDRSVVDLGDLQARQGRTLAGRFVCSDGKRVPSGTLLWVSCEHTDGRVELQVSDTGSFESKGLPDGRVALRVEVPRDPAATRYRVSAQNKCSHPAANNQLEGQLDHDITDLTILLEPDPEQDLQLRRSIEDIDLAVLADFKDARAGPITGIPPRRQD